MGERADLYLMINAGLKAVRFALPAAPGGRSWHLQADTFRPAPADFPEAGREPRLDDQSGYRMEPRSAVILIAPR
jgi:glycogen operon protein